MKPWLEDMLSENPSVQIAPLIDCVFLLLIYFMITASLKKQEADLGISLPGNVTVARQVQMPDETIIEIDEENRVVLNNTFYSPESGRDMPDLVTTLIRYRQQSEASQNKALVTILAHDDSVHQRTIDVMNACAAANIKHITFGMGD